MNIIHCRIASSNQNPLSFGEGFLGRAKRLSEPSGVGSFPPQNHTMPA